MTKNKIKALCSALLLSTLVVPAYATTTANLAGPVFFNTSNTPVRPRIYHAFDLPFANQIQIPNGTNVGATFTAESTLSPAIATSVNDNLSAIAAKGYTHILVSPPTVVVPSTSASGTSWNNAYKPYICVLDSNYQTNLNTAFQTLGIAETPYSKYGYTLSDGTVIGFRLGSDRYGSASDLATLIMNAKTNNLGVIVDVTLHQTGWQGGTTGSAPSTTGNSAHLYAVTYVPGSTPTYTLSGTDLTQVHPTTDSTATNLFTGSGSYTNGPLTLNTSLPAVQTMIAGYLQLLKDMGVAGIRIYGLSSSLDNVSSVLQAISQSSSAAPSFSFGFGEDSAANSSSSADAVAFAPTLPLEDFALQSQLATSFTKAIGGNSFGLSNPSIRPKAAASAPNMAMPQALIGNTPAITFSVTPSMYPLVGTLPTGGFYPNSSTSINSSDTAQSQLATAYLCSIRNGSPMVLRYEDERDTSSIIKKALAFRVLMEQYNAPHEYISTLSGTVGGTSNVLLIARQYGFVIINNGDSDYSSPTNDISILSATNLQLPYNAAKTAQTARFFSITNGSQATPINTPSLTPVSAYIPAGTYQEITSSALSSGISSWQSSTAPTYTISWNGTTSSWTKTTVSGASYNTPYSPTAGYSYNNAPYMTAASSTTSGSTTTVVQTAVCYNNNSSTQYINSTTTTKVGSSASTNTGTDPLKVPANSARFFVLTTPTIPAACTVTFTANEFSSVGQQVAVVGNTPLLGAWSIRPDLLNAMMPSGKPGAWSSGPLRFPVGLPIVYQDVIGSGGTGTNTLNSNAGVSTWEYGGNFSNNDRLLMVPSPSSYVNTYQTPDNATVTVIGDQVTVARPTTQPASTN